MAQELRTARATGTLPAELMKAMMASQMGQEAAGPKPPSEVPVSPVQPPLVVAMLVVADVNRLRFAQAAVNNFFRQTYTNKHLVVVNGVDPATYPAEEKLPDGTTVQLTPAQRDARTTVTTREHPWLTEVRVPAGMTVGAMRNRAMTRMPQSAGWVTIWDDDNFAHPHRIAFQMAHRVGDAPVMLRSEVRVDVVNAVACRASNPAGIHSTLLFPATDIQTPFPDQTGYEDAAFWIKNWGGKQVVVPNAETFPGTVMQVAFWHGRNVTTRQQFLGEYADPAWYKKAAISAAEVTYLNSEIGPVYGANFAATPTKETPAAGLPA